MPGAVFVLYVLASLSLSAFADVDVSRTSWCAWVLTFYSVYQSSAPSGFLVQGLLTVLLRAALPPAVALLAQMVLVVTVVPVFSFRPIRPFHSSQCVTTCRVKVVPGQHKAPLCCNFLSRTLWTAWKLMTVIPVIKCQTGFLYTEENSQIAWCMTITGDIVWQIRHGVLLPYQRQRQQERHLGLPQVLYYSGCPQLSTINPDHCLRKGPVHSIRVPSQ